VSLPLPNSIMSCSDACSPRRIPEQRPETAERQRSQAKQRVTFSLPIVVPVPPSVSADRGFEQVIIHANDSDPVYSLRNVFYH
jgi:hypothetical protein